MYLKASKYLSGGWKHSTDAEKKQHAAVCRAAKIPKSAFCENSGGMEVSWTAAYWRKANAIHKWFVDNVQGGNDQCQLSYVSREQLQKLYNLCSEVLADKSLAATKLPPQSGFFFGSTEISDWYWSDIQYTVEQLKNLLDNQAFEDCEFYYQASW